MEKRNVFEERRTPCTKGKSACACDCDSCKTLNKHGSDTPAVPEKPAGIHDAEAMAKVHK